MSQAATYYNDFQTLADVHVTNAGTGSVYLDDPTSYPDPANVVGLLIADTGGTAGSEAKYDLCGGQESIVLGEGVFDMTWRVGMPGAPAAGAANDYRCAFGVDQGDGINFDGISWTCGVGSTGNDHWWAQVVAGPSNPPNFDTGVVVDGSMHVFRVVYDSSGPLASFYIDGVLVGTIAATISPGASVGPYLAMDNLLANTNRLARADYFTYTYTFATPR